MERITQEHLYELLLQLNEDWAVERIALSERDELNVELAYIGQPPLDGHGARMTMYDHKPIREWRHLDTMQYKTILQCRLPRFKDSSGKVHTVEVPWASSGERHTSLLEKKSD